MVVYWHFSVKCLCGIARCPSFIASGASDKVPAQAGTLYTFGMYI